MARRTNKRLLRIDAREEGQQLMTRFQALRQSGAATTIGQNYLEQGRYAEAIVSTGAENELVDKSPPRVTFEESNIGLSDLAQTGASTLFDFDNDGDLDFVAFNEKSSQMELFRNEGGKFSKVEKAVGDLSKPLKTKVSGIISGDFDSDNFSDLLVFGTGQTKLFRGNGTGGFADVTEASRIPVNLKGSITGAFVDADHDGDLDIFLGGFGESSTPNQLLRNNGDGTFLDVSETAKLDLPSKAVAVVPTDFDNRRDVDLLVANRTGKPNLFRNLRDGSFKDVADEVGLNRFGNWTCAAAGDFNKDSFTDFFFGRSDGPGVFATSNGRGSFVLKDAPTGTENAASAQILDYDNDGLLDLVTVNNKGLAITRNLGDDWAKSDSSVFKTKQSISKTNAAQILSADLDGDGDIDLLFVDKGGVHFLQNVGGNSNNSEVVRLQGRVSNRTGIGAKIDLRAGSLTQKLESYSASPMPAPSDIHFGLGKREKPDAIRVIWSSGVVQAEVDFPEKTKSFAAVKIEELDRKPSSCPYLYAWNGKEFEFITDFLGGGEMGNWKSPGDYHFPDSDEFVRITSDQLKPKDGKYELRITNELEEVLFLDKLKLVAVEHDENTEVYPNEGLGIPTTGKQILYGTRNEHPPISATNSLGQDVLPKIVNIDRRFYADFDSLDIRGYAKTHYLTLDLDDKQGFDGRTLLLLTGWTDYAFSSDNLAASQSGKSQFLPQLQVRNKAGEWETVIDSIGISIGRPQTIVVDLTGKFLTNSREVRIVTNFKTYWDKIAVDTSKEFQTKSFELNPSVAKLTERGFSVESSINDMIVPSYKKVVDDGRWKYFSGKFTRLGDVIPLLDQIDDIFVVSKTGDELVLTFDAMPDLPKGKKYTFLLYADGYSKEMDINSGSPDAVFPMPFKGMSKYPYGADERYPMTEERRLLYEAYSTRTVKGVFPRIEASIPR